MSLEPDDAHMAIIRHLQARIQDLADDYPKLLRALEESGAREMKLRDALEWALAEGARFGWPPFVLERFEAALGGGA